MIQSCNFRKKICEKLCTYDHFFAETYVAKWWPFVPVPLLHFTSRNTLGEHLLPGLLQQAPVCSLRYRQKYLHKSTHKKCYKTSSLLRTMGLFFILIYVIHPTDNPTKAIDPFCVKRALYTLFISLWHNLLGVSDIHHQLASSPDIPPFIPSSAPWFHYISYCFSCLEYSPVLSSKHALHYQEYHVGIEEAF